MTRRQKSSRRVIAVDPEQQTRAGGPGRVSERRCLPSERLPPRRRPRPRRSQRPSRPRRRRPQSRSQPSPVGHRRPARCGCCAHTPCVFPVHAGRLPARAPAPAPPAESQTPQCARTRSRVSELLLLAAQAKGSKMTVAEAWSAPYVSATPCIAHSRSVSRARTHAVQAPRSVEHVRTRASLLHPLCRSKRASCPRAASASCAAGSGSRRCRSRRATSCTSSCLTWRT